MQISDLVGQYHQNSQAPTETVTGVKGVEQLVATVRGMTAGNIFEGTVNSMKNGQVVLGLSNGQQLSARIDGKVPIQVGQSMFFQVKSNNGTTVAIRPFTVDGASGNLTLLDALKAAGLSADADNLNMVNSMMQEQLPIDKNHVAQMARLMQKYPGIDATTIVQMNKLNIPISVENASQFENYQGDRQAIGKELSNLMNELPQMLANDSLSLENLLIQNDKVLSIILNGMPETAQTAESEGILEQMNGEVANAEAPETQEAETAATAETAAGAELAGKDTDITAPQEQVQKTAEQAAQNLDVQDSTGEEVLLGHKEEQLPEHTLGRLLINNQMKELAEQLKNLGITPENSNLFEDGELKADVKGEEVLRALQQAFSGGNGQDTALTKDSITKLFSGKAMGALLSDSLEMQWLIKPEELAQDKKVQSLYEKLDTQMKQIENIIKATGSEQTQFAQTASDIRSNMTFMEQINQNYTYVQIPLKMSGQNANGELYVYTNKKSLAEGTEDLTAFLHLDMEQLGPTDVSLRLHGKEISTNFYMSDDASFALIQEHLPELEERLKKKGYTCKLQVTNESKKVNFVEDFLKKDQPSAGQLRRYSFDVRA